MRIRASALSVSVMQRPSIILYPVCMILVRNPGVSRTRSYAARSIIALSGRYWSSGTYCNPSQRPSFSSQASGPFLSEENILNLSKRCSGRLIKAYQGFPTFSMQRLVYFQHVKRSARRIWPCAFNLKPYSYLLSPSMPQ